MQAFTPFQLGPLQLRNRFLRTAAFEGMSQGGQLSDALIEHHRRVAQGGVAMTTLSYCSVSRTGRTFAHQLLMSAQLLPRLRDFCDAVHAEGAATCIQLGHGGGFASPAVIGQRPLAPSPWFNLYGLSLSRAMNPVELRDCIADFGRAVRWSMEAGFDAVELHMGHGYLLSQFLSPSTNWRRDDFGGSLQGRMRLGLMVLREARRVAGPDYPILVKMNLRDGFDGGLALDEAVACARAFEDQGASALVLSGGFVSRTPFYMLRGAVPTGPMLKVQPSWWRKVGLAAFGHLLVKEYAFERAFFREDALEVRKQVSLPLVFVGGLRTRVDMERILSDGFDLLALGRPLIMNPDFVNELERGDCVASACEPCNHCIAEMDRGGVRCVAFD